MAQQHPLGDYVLSALSAAAEDNSLTYTPEALELIDKSFRNAVAAGEGDPALDAMFQTIGLLQQRGHTPAADLLVKLLQDFRGQRKQQKREADDRLAGRSKFLQFQDQTDQVTDEEQSTDGAITLDDLKVPKRV